MLSFWKFNNAMTSITGNIILVSSVTFDMEACNIITSTSAESKTTPTIVNKSKLLKAKLILESKYRDS